MPDNRPPEGASRILVALDNAPSRAANRTALLVSSGRGPKGSKEGTVEWRGFLRSGEGREDLSSKSDSMDNFCPEVQRLIRSFKCPTGLHAAKVPISLLGERQGKQQWHLWGSEVLGFSISSVRTSNHAPSKPFGRYRRTGSSV